MSERAQDASRWRLDAAIDRTVHELTSREAPRDVRARVLARLAARPTLIAQRLVSSAHHPAPIARPLWKPQRLAWAGAALALGVTLVLVASRWRERLAPDSAPVTTADRATAPAPPPASATTQPGDVAAAPPETAAAPSAPARHGARSPAVIAAGLLEYAGRPPFIDPLPVPEPIAIAALETERVIPKRVDIAPLRFDAVQIEPIQVQR